VLDNALFAGLVFTLPAYFNWGIQSIWWIKVTTAALESLVVAVWLKGELQRIRSRMSPKGKKGARLKAQGKK